MEHIIVKEVYNVDTISKGNSKAWIKLMDVMKTKENDVLFDFKGIEVVQPWATPEFMMFMQNEHVHIKLWFSKDTVNSINLMCSLNGIKSTRATNEDAVPTKALTQEEIKIRNMAKQLQSYFEVNGDEAIFNVHKRFDQIGVAITVEYIEAAIKLFCDENNIRKVFVEANGILVQASVIERLTQIIRNMADNDIIVNIHSEDTEVMNKVSIYQALAKNKFLSDEDKIKMINAKLTRGKVGMLIKYKESKSTDEFGRSGKGKTASCRAAIFNGLKKTPNGVVASITTFNGNTFYTNIHWGLEHDNVMLEKLDKIDELIPISDIGIYNDFLGSKYHFIAPIQTRKEDTITMYGINELGKVTYTKMTIPERIKAVFDDWGIEYEQSSLDEYIEKTREILEKQ